MTERHELRWGGLAGLAFVVLAILGRFLPGNPPTVGDSNSTISSWVSDHRTTILFSSLLWAAAAGLVIWFAVAFAEAMRERAERSDVHLALMAGAVLVGGAIFVNAGMQAALASGIRGRDAAITMSMFQLSALTTTLIGFAAALPLAAAGIGVLRTHVMPDWLGYLSLLAAVVSFLGAFGVFATSGAFVAGGWLMSTVPLLLSAIWVLAASGYMVREHLPELTTGPETAVPQM
ncbi:DUF4386 family protein [Kribbella sp. GL6]|uniref:DUF4386 family protein n=1 Tax=Kribbella sp. GL6 TaxID=3419765 RepID=UPI003CFF22C6